MARTPTNAIYQFFFIKFFIRNGVERSQPFRLISSGTELAKFFVRKGIRGLPRNFESRFPGFPQALGVFFSLNLWINLQQGKMPSKTQWRPGNLLIPGVEEMNLGGWFGIAISYFLMWRGASDAAEKYGRT